GGGGEGGWVRWRGPGTECGLGAAAGLRAVTADVCNGKVTGVTFRNVPAFATHIDEPIEIPRLGTVKVDIAYGGMFYVIADAQQFGLRLTPDEGRDIVRIGEMIKAAASEQLSIVPPENALIHSLRTAQLSRPPHDAHHH